MRLPSPNRSRSEDTGPASRSTRRDVERAADMLVKAQRPILFGGGGIRIADASEPFTAIAELLMAPVITTLQGKGTFPEDILSRLDP